MSKILVKRDNLKKKIKELGYTYEGVCNRAEIGVSTLGQMINNPEYVNPGVFTRKRLARALETTEDELFMVVGAIEKSS